MTDLDRQPGALEPLGPDRRAVVGQRGEHGARVWLLGETLDPQHDLHLDDRRRIELLLHVPPSV